MKWIIRIGGLLIAIIGHEVAHGYMAYILGDPTAKSEGRLSLNPLNHIDPIGLISMIILKFGWAKAVPINPGYFKHRKRDTILVSLAGVGYNFIAAIIFGLFFVLTLGKNEILTQFFVSVLWYNVMLGVFNLVPLPPLDGSKVVISLFPEKVEYFFYRNERYLYILLVIAVFSGFVSRVIGPIIFSIIDGIINGWSRILL